MQVLIYSSTITIKKRQLACTRLETCGTRAEVDIGILKKNGYISNAWKRIYRQIKRVTDKTHIKQFNKTTIYRSGTPGIVLLLSSITAKAQFMMLDANAELHMCGPCILLNHANGSSPAVWSGLGCNVFLSVIGQRDRCSCSVDNSTNLTN